MMWFIWYIIVWSGASLFCYVLRRRVSKRLIPSLSLSGSVWCLAWAPGMHLKHTLARLSLVSGAAIHVSSAAAAAAEPPPPYPPSVLAPPASLGRKSDCASSRRPRDASIRDSRDASDREVEMEPSCSVERGTPPAGPPPAGPPGPAPANPEASEHAAPRLAVREPPLAGSGRVPAGDEETMSHFEPRPCPAAPPDGFTQPPPRRAGPPPPGPRCHEYGPGPTSPANLFATSSTLQSP
eukprot:scaffold7979_cov129-Isochrysis_galbana.AAC.2